MILFAPLLLAFGALVFWSLPLGWRPGATVALNLAFLAAVMTPVAAVLLLAFLAAVYALIWLGPRLRLWVAVGAVLTLYVWLKAPPVLAGVPVFLDFPTIVGLSFVLFRCLHLVVDCAAGDRERPTIGQFAGYTTHWPCLLSGPIQLYGDYRAQMAAMPARPDGAMVARAVSLILSGFFFAAVLGGIARAAFAVVGGGAASGPAGLGAAGAAYFVFLYFNFAGYTRIARGVALLFGVTVPDNFRAPWKSRNLLEFWSRWHITLSGWLRTYVFVPAMRGLAEIQPAQAGGLVHGLAATFLTFLLIGLWHGDTLAFVGYGLVLALGCSATLLYQRTLRAVAGKERTAALAASAWYQLACGMLTLGFMAVATAPVWMDGPHIGSTVQRVGASGLVIAVGAAGALLLPVVAGGVLIDRRSRAVDLAARLWSGAAATALRHVAYVVVSLAWVLNDVPDNLTFIYQQF